MFDALNGSVAPFCHSQDRPGGVPVAIFDQPAGLTGERNLGWKSSMAMVWWFATTFWDQTRSAWVFRHSSS